MAPDRLTCCVPFCTHSRQNRDGSTEWICRDHWRLIPKARRRAWSRQRRRLVAAIAREPLVAEWWKMAPGSPERLVALAMWRVHHRLWKGLKRVAIERAGGL